MEIQLRFARLGAKSAIGPALALVGYATLRDTGHAGWAAWLLAVNFAWAAVDRDRQFLHDHIAATRIVADT